MNRREWQLYFLARALAWRLELEELDAAAVLSVERVLRAAQKDVAGRLRQEAEGLAELSDWRRERDAAFNAWADEVLAGTRASLAETVREAANIAAAASMAAANRMLSLDGAARAVNSVALGAEQIKSFFAETPLGPGGLARWVDTALAGGVKNSLLEALRKAAIEGKGTAESVRRVMLAANDAGFVITRREAVTLTRTFIQTANEKAHEAVYRANEHLFKGYRRVGALDNRACPACALADGAEYALDEERPALPAHPNCRCLYVPIAKSWKDFGLNAKEADLAARPWTIREPGAIGAGGRKIENFGTTKENYEGWWKSLPADEKAKAAIGPKRRKLLESGAVKWADLWDKKTGRVRRLDELEGLARGRQDTLKRLGRWLKGPGKPFPLATLSRADAALLGAKSPVALLSAQTLAKQKARHPELTAADYALAQEAVERGKKIRQTDKKMAYVLDRPGGLAVIVKATEDGEELYTVSLFRLSEKEGKRKKALRILARK